MSETTETKSKKKTTKRVWVTKDDRKLLQLIETGKIDITNTKKPNIDFIRTTYYKWASYKNFSALFRKRVKEYNLTQTLKGARGKSFLLFPSMDFYSILRLNLFI
jgi:hypothetical protein